LRKIIFNSLSILVVGVLLTGCGTAIKKVNPSLSKNSMNQSITINSLPNTLIVNAHSSVPENKAPNINNVKIMNKNDVQEMYKILMNSPELPKGPISCPSDNGISYTLIFKSNKMNTKIEVEPTGCEGVTIGKNNTKTLMGNKEDNKFWNLLGKDLGMSYQKLRGQ
jgi:hypothetical protein